MLKNANPYHLIGSLMLVLILVAPVFSEEFSITDFSPKKGTEGDNIIIYGKGFAFHNLSSNKVKFNNKPADVVFAESARLVTTVPKGAIPGAISISNSKNGITYSKNVFEVVVTSDQIASSGTALGKGDRVILDTYLSGIMNSDFPDEKYYASPESKLWVSEIDSSGKAHIRFKENWSNDKVGTGDTNDKYEANNKGGLVKPGIEYTIEAVKLQHAPVSIQGVDYGVLVVPYKFHFSDQTLTGEATLGGYAGYRFSWPGFALTVPLLSAGVGVVNETTTGETKSAPSFSLATGTIITLTKTGLFQIGLLGGVDWAGKGNHYKYEGKPWVAVSFGTNISK